MKKSRTVDLPEVEDIIDDTPETLLLEYLRNHPTLPTSIAHLVIKSTSTRAHYWLKKLEGAGLVTGTIKQVKLKGDPQYRRQTVWTLKR